MSRYVSEWRNKPSNPALDRRVVEAIARRRRQILVHSCIYYHLDDNVISDHTWTLWAKQLAKLQDKYGWRIGFYDKVFKDWNGSTGHHLPHTDAGVLRSATRLLELHKAGADILVTKRVVRAIEQHKELTI